MASVKYNIKINGKRISKWIIKQDLEWNSKKHEKSMSNKKRRKKYHKRDKIGLIENITFSPMNNKF